MPRLVILDEIISLLLNVPATNEFFHVHLSLGQETQFGNEEQRRFAQFGGKKSELEKG